jgi:hypothetical protein
MVSDDLTTAVRRFSEFGGKSLAEENPHTLMLKFVCFRFFPQDWQQLYRDTFTNDRRLEKQIDALEQVRRERMPELSESRWFDLLSNMLYQHGVDEQAHLIVQARSRPQTVPNYQQFSQQVKEISSSLSQHRDTLFLLHLTTPQLTRKLIYDAAVMQRLGVPYTTVQGQLMPMISAQREQNRVEKLRELSNILQVTRYDLSALNMPLLQDYGCVQNNVSVAELQSNVRKRVYEKRLQELMAKRDQLYETLDEVKLSELYEDGIRSKLQWKPVEGRHYRKHELSTVCEAMQDVVKILTECQMDTENKHHKTLGKIESLRQQRAELIRGARQSQIYAEGKRALIEWQVPSTRGMTFPDAVSTVNRLQTYIDQLKTYQMKKAS